jgi:hypothetical protein
VTSTSSETAPVENRQGDGRHVITRTWGRFDGLAVFALYTTVSLFCLARALPGHPGFYVGRNTDPPQTMWFFNWWLYSLSHRLNPFFTDWVWAPLGINLAWTAIVPLLAWISIPLQLTVGEPATYNLIVILALPLAALSAFLLCRRVTGAFWPSVLGGYIFGFSPYMLGQSLEHLVLIAVFPVPLIVLLTLKKLDGDISARRFAILLAALLVVQFLCFPEIVATFTVVGAIALLLALALFDGGIRARLLRIIPPAAAGYLIAGVVLSPYLYFLLFRGFPHDSVWQAGNYSADLLAFLVPTPTVMLGTARAAVAISQTLKSGISENGAYLGVAIIFFVEMFRRRYWRTPVGKFLTILFVVLAIAAMGPSLHVAGRQGFSMPWAIIGRLPLLSIVLPVRLMMYEFLVVAVMVAMWFPASSTRPLTKWIAAAVILVSLAPNLHASFWVSALDIPAFFTDRTYATELQPRQIILPLPWGQRGNSMYWQLQSDMYFRMAGGYTGEFAPFEFTRMPVANYFYGGIDLPEPGEQLKAYLARFGARAVIADPNEENFPSFKATLDSLGVPSQNEKGVWLYKIPNDAFAAYAKLPVAQVEARANALRFDAIVEAAGKYLADGHDPSKISPLELKRLDLIPHDWLVSADSSAYRDWQIAPAPGGQIGIIIVGSYEGVRPLIERYRAIAAEIDYPAPTRWTPDSHPRLDVIKPLLATFDSAHLAAAARELRDSPPPERTTPFVTGVTAGF